MIGAFKFVGVWVACLIPCLVAAEASFEFSVTLYKKFSPSPSGSLGASTWSQSATVASRTSTLEPTGILIGLRSPRTRHGSS